MNFEGRMERKVIHKKLFIKIIVFAVTIAFLCQNIALAAPNSKRYPLNTIRPAKYALAPRSKTKDLQKEFEKKYSEGGGKLVKRKKIIIPDLIAKALFSNLQVTINYLSTLEKLLTELTDGNRFVRESSAEELKTLAEAKLVSYDDVKGKLHLEILLAGLTDEYWQVRESSAEALKTLAEAKLVSYDDVKGGLHLEKLLAGLTDEEWFVRESSAEALKALVEAKLVSYDNVKGKLHLKKLLTGLTDENWQVRQSSAEALKALVEAKLVSYDDVKGKLHLEKLIAGLTDEDEAVRKSSAKAIKALVDAKLVSYDAVEEKRLLEKLIAGLTDEDEAVRQSSAEALKALAEAKLVSYDDVKGKLPLEELIAGLTDENWSVRQSSAEALKALAEAKLVSYDDVKGKLPLEKLLTGLTDGNWSVRQSSTEVLNTLAEAKLVSYDDVKGKLPLEKLLTGLTDGNRFVHQSSAEVLKTLAEAKLVSYDDVKGKLHLEKLLAGLFKGHEYMLQASAEALKALVEAKLVSYEDVKGKLDLEKLIAGLTHVRRDVRKSRAEVLKALVEAKLVARKEVKGLDLNEVKWLYKNLSNAELEDTQRAFILKAHSISQGRISQEEVSCLAGLIDSAQEDSPHLETMLDIMVYFSLNGSSGAQDILEGRVRQILRRKAQPGKIIQTTMKDNLIVEKTLKSFQQKSFEPFIYRRDFKPELRLLVICGLAQRGTIDTGYANYVDIEEDKQQAYLDIISQVYEELEIISPKILTEMIDSGRTTVAKVKSNMPKLKKVESSGDCRNLMVSLAKDTNLMIAYYTFRQPVFIYQGTSSISFERFEAIIRRAVESLKHEKPEILTKTLKYSFIQAGLTPEEASQIVESLLKGSAPLPSNSRFLSEDGSFIPQEVDVLAGPDLSGVLDQAQQSFASSQDDFIRILKLSSLLSGIPKGIKKFFKDNPEERKTLSLKYDGIVSDIKRGTVSLAECLNRLEELNNQIYLNQEVPITQMLDKAVNRLVGGVIAKNVCYQGLFSKGKGKPTLVIEEITLKDLYLGNLPRNIEKLVSYLGEQRKRGRLSSQKNEILGAGKVTPETALRVFLYDLAGKAKIKPDSSLSGMLKETIGDMVKSFENYQKAIDKVGSLSGGIPQVVYLDYIDKNNLFEALRFSDGAHCCNSSDPKINSRFGGGIYENNAHRWLTDATTFFFQVTTESRGERQIGWLKCWLGIDKDGLPFVGSNYLYLAPVFQNSTLKEAILQKVEEVLFSTRISRIAQAKASHLPANSLLPSESYKEVDLENFVRLQSLEDDEPIQADVKIEGNVPTTAKFFVKENPEAIEFLLDKLPMVYEEEASTVAKAVGNMVEAGFGIDKIEDFILVELPDKWGMWVGEAAETAGKIAKSGIIGKLVKAGMKRPDAVEFALEKLPMKFCENAYKVAEVAEKIAGSGIIDELEKAGMERPEAVEFLLKELPLKFGKKAYKVAEVAEKIAGSGIIGKLVKAGMERPETIEFLLKELPLKFGQKSYEVAETAEKIAGSGIIGKLVKAGMDERRTIEVLLKELPTVYGRHAYIAAEAILDSIYSEGKAELVDTDEFLKIIAGRLPEEVSSLKASLRSFKEGLKIISEKKLLRYINAKDADRILDVMLLDDNQSVFNHIIPFLERLTDREKKDFINNVFLYVPGDKGVDSNGAVSHIQLLDMIRVLNNIPGEGTYWRERILKHDTKNPTFIQLREELIEEGGCFKKWDQFQRLKLLANMIIHEDLLDEIECYLDGTERGKTLYSYYNLLILHSAMTDYDALRKMILNPEKFLELPDKDTPLKIHNVKKLSMFLNLEYIDIGARELIDGLILGLFNNLNVLPLDGEEAEHGEVISELDGVLPLSYEDTFEVNYIVREKYRIHLALIDMELMGVAYNEKLKGDRRKNLSFGYFEKGKLLGYVIAYVGYDKVRDEEIIFISNFAVLDKKSVAASCLLKALFGSIQDCATLFREKYSKDIRVLFQATTAKDGSYWLFMPGDDDCKEVKEKKERRLTNEGLKIEEEIDLHTGMVEFVMRIQPLPDFLKVEKTTSTKAAKADEEELKHVNAGEILEEISRADDFFGASL